MEVLVLDGKSYVKASKAAKDLGYATDYVGQLCRSGQVDAHLIGRTWYVNQDQLGNHRFEKKRMSRVKAREQAKKAIAAHRLRVTETPKDYRNIDIRYESDNEELIPEVKKLEVQSVGERPQRMEQEKYDSETTIVNRGQKVRMSGDIEVVDVTDAPVEADAVFLTPGRIRSGTITVPSPTDLHKTPPSTFDDSSDSVPLTFEEKLGALSDTEDTVATEYPEDEGVENTRDAAAAGGRFVYVLVVLATVCIAILTIPVTATHTYSSEVTDITTSYDFVPADVVTLIRSKI